MDRRQFVKLSTATALGVTAIGWRSGGSVAQATPAFVAPRRAGRRAIVVGAGLAGLTAARRLHEGGFEVVVLEARDRVGGRIASLDGFIGHPIELGGAWVQKNDPIVHDLIRGLRQIADDGEGVTFARSGSRSWRELSGREQQRLDDAIQDVQEKAEQERTGSLTTMQEVVDQLQLKTDERQYVTAEFASSAGALPSELGARDYAEEGDDDIDTIILGDGTSALTARLATSLDIRLFQVVTAIQHGPDGVRIQVQSGDALEADFAIVTAPLSILKLQSGPGAIVFDPPLGPAKREAIELVGYGVFDKLILRFEERFWGDDWTFLGLLEEHQNGPTVYSNASRGRSGRERASGAALTVELTADWGRLMTPAPGDLAAEVRLVELVTERLRDVFGAGRVDNAIGNGTPLPTYLVQSWSHDPFARGCYSVATPGSGRARRALAEPESNRLLFAGEAIGGVVDGERRTATITAAALSGANAAARVMSLAG